MKYVSQKFVASMEGRISDKEGFLNDWTSWQPDRVELFEAMLRNLEDAANAIRLAKRRAAWKELVDLANYAMKAAEVFGDPEARD